MQRALRSGHLQKRRQLHSLHRQQNHRQQRRYINQRLQQVQIRILHDWQHLHRLPGERVMPDGQHDILLQRRVLQKRNQLRGLYDTKRYKDNGRREADIGHEHQDRRRRHRAIGLLYSPRNIQRQFRAI
jgi:hypothetical protein